MSWTTPADLRAQVQKLWDRGLLLADPSSLFPLRLQLKDPTSSELSNRFAEVQSWIAQLRTMPQLRIEWRELRHRVIGSNRLPDTVWLDCLDDALSLIGKHEAVDRFRKLSALTAGQQPAVMPWLAAHPLSVLQLADVWPQLLDIIGWMQAHPRPGIYLRQIDVPGVHSKLVEAHRATLAPLLDLALPADAIDTQASGIANFNRRYGFRDEPPRLRFRILDPALALTPGGCDQDISLRKDAFAQLQLPVTRAFITENKTNFLAFPAVPASLVIWGEGYGFDMLGEADWLKHCALHYWGDIDTHGFAILDQLRSRLPHTQSFLMDRDTLMAHRSLWGSEATPLQRDLLRLSPEESALYDDLRDQRLSPSLRLEQEHIGYAWLIEKLRTLLSEPPQLLNP